VEKVTVKVFLLFPFNFILLFISRVFQVSEVFLEEPGFLESQVYRAYREFKAFPESA